MFLHFFPGMTPEFVVHGFNGNGMPWDWWETGKAFIDGQLKRE